MRSTRGLILALVAAAALVSIGEACVGDNPAEPEPGGSNEAGAATGDRGGPCFPDGKCKEGLVCDGVVCALIDGSNGTPADSSTTTDGGSGDAPDDAPEDAPAVDARCTLSPYDASVPSSIECFGTGNECAGNDLCCASETNGQCRMNGSCLGSEHLWLCSSETQCGGGSPCCKLSGTVDASDCDPGGKQLFPANGAACTSNCFPGANDVQLCSGNATCGEAGTCKPVDVVLAGKRLQLHACLP